MAHRVRDLLRPRRVGKALAPRRWTAAAQRQRQKGDDHHEMFQLDLQAMPVEA
jgi:hypothetical protein